MSFTSPLLLFLFLPISLIFYYLVPQKLKNLYLLILSILFYSWADLSVLGVMLILILGNWSVVRSFQIKETRKLLFWVGVSVNILILAFYKYISPTLPLGFSFFIFHSLSYLIDSYKSDLKDKSLLNLGIYSLYFPHVSAGPISRSLDFFEKLKGVNISFAMIYDGIILFVVGFAQKMLLANTFALVANQVFADLHNLSFASAWLGLVMYTLQIYFDFAGYSNMAIGISRMLGICLPQNFNLPYIATSITDFWSRWHISLTAWLRQYVYFSLGGNRLGKARTYLNIIIVFIVSGLWHGTGFNFLIWGLWHGLFMVLERWLVDQKINLAIPKIFKHLYALLVIMFGWVLFRVANLSDAITYLTTLFGGRGYSNSTIYWLSYLSPYTILATTLGVLFALGLGRVFFRSMVAQAMIFPLVFVMSILAVAGSTYSSFIYTQF